MFNIAGEPKVTLKAVGPKAVENMIKIALYLKDKITKEGMYIAAIG